MLLVDKSGLHCSRYEIGAVAFPRVQSYKGEIGIAPKHNRPEAIYRSDRTTVTKRLRRLLPGVTCVAVSEAVDCQRRAA